MFCFRVEVFCFFKNLTKQWAGSLRNLLFRSIIVILLKWLSSTVQIILKLSYKRSMSINQVGDNTMFYRFMSFVFIDTSVSACFHRRTLNVKASELLFNRLDSFFVLCAANNRIKGYRYSSVQSSMHVNSLSNKLK
jgi:hypothetical protein